MVSKAPKKIALVQAMIRRLFAPNLRGNCIREVVWSCNAIMSIPKLRTINLKGMGYSKQLKTKNKECEEFCRVLDRV